MPVCFFQMRRDSSPMQRSCIPFTLPTLDFHEIVQGMVQKPQQTVTRAAKGQVACQVQEE